MWEYMALIPALGSKSEADLCVQHYSGLQSKFEKHQECTEKPCLQNNKQTKNQNQKPFSKV